ncbi:MAG: cation:proton antiporter [Thermoleophilaceae bacterium]
MTDPAPRGKSLRTRLPAFYVVLVVAAVAVVSVMVSLGQDQEPQPDIAGGYDVTGGESACLGPRFDVSQSGQFITIENPEGTLSGKLRFKDGEVKGDVDCLEGGKAELTARPQDGTLTGTVGGQEFTAEAKRDAPEPGSRRARAPDGIAGEYHLEPRSDCLGGGFEIEGDGPAYEVIRREEAVGEVAYEDGRVAGEVACPTGGRAEVSGEAVDRHINLVLEPAAGDPFSSGEGTAPSVERVTAEKGREFGHLLAAFFIAVVVVMLAARFLGVVAVKVGQPRVMGEVTAGILLGPTLFGKVLPDAQAAIFPTDVIPYIAVAANLGLVFYMFLVGMEIDASQLRGRVTQAAMISNGSVTFAMLLGISAAVPLYALVGPDSSFLGFALFMGVTMSITAFPVLARILVERRMLKRPLGAVAIACAAMDDVTAWFLIALATAVAVGGSGSEVLQTIGLAVAFGLVMFLLIRPLLGRASDAFDEAGRVPGGWIVAIFAGVLVAAYITEIIGIALILGAFVMGAIMPRHAGLTEDVTHRVEDFVVTLLLPLFFAATGLRTDLFLLDRPELVLLTVALIALALTGKLVGATLFARFTGFKWRDSMVIGSLMNTRGLTELIVLNIALEKGVISEALFAALVIMALVTTFMTGPLLKLLDPKNELGAPVEEELEEARARTSLEFPTLQVPERAILVAPQADSGLAQLMSLAQPLARSEPPRELILARLVQPPRSAAIRGGLQTESRLLRDASDEVHAAQRALAEAGVAARAVATTSADAGVDLARLAKEEEVDLVLADGRRPLLGEGVPRGEIGVVLHQAPSDVAVLVAKEGAPVAPGPDAAVVVPFGGAEHDWAALELGAWMASATGAPLRLLGAAGSTEDRPAVERRLGDAGILVQSYAGIAAEPVVADPGREGVVEAATGAGLLVIGLSERWQKEGLGATRSEIARAAPAPTLFVRRGTRPGALAPAADVTKFGWSSPGMGAGGGLGDLQR